LVERVLVVSSPDGGLRGIGLTEMTIETPWIKDYDAVKGEGPTGWPKRFDTSRWGLIAAYDGDTRIGGAVIAPGVASPTLRRAGGGTSRRLPTGPAARIGAPPVSVTPGLRSASASVLDRRFSKLTCIHDNPSIA
jgi:hypothetical protein